MSKRSSNIVNNELAEDLKMPSLFQVSKPGIEESIDFLVIDELQAANDISIPSHIVNKHTNPEHVDNFDEIEAEDFVSDSLIKDSPVLRTKSKKPTEQFMMNLRSTIEEGLSQHSSNNQASR